MINLTYEEICAIVEVIYDNIGDDDTKLGTNTPLTLGLDKLLELGFRLAN